MLRAELAAALHEGHGGSHEIHVAGDRLDDDAGDVPGVQRERFFELRDVVVLQHHGVLHHFGGHAGAGRVAESGEAGAGFHEQRVGMAVITAFELDDGVAAGRAAGEANRAHARFGAGTHQADHLDRRHQAHDLLGQLDLALGRRAEGKALHGGLLHRLQHRGMAVPEDHRSPRSDVVDVALAVRVPEVRPQRARDETRCAAHGAERAHRRIHAAGNELARALEKLLVAIRDARVAGFSAWCHGRACRRPAGPALLLG